MKLDTKEKRPSAMPLTGEIAAQEYPEAIDDVTMSKSGEGCSILVSKKRKHRFGHLWVVNIKGGSDYFLVYIHSLDYLRLVC